MSLISTSRGIIDHWQGTTQYIPSQLRSYGNSATTDSNGRVTFNLTDNGLVGGNALFSSILTIAPVGLDGSGNPLQAPLFFVESLSTTAITIRGVRGISQGILIGGTINTLQYVGAGYTVYLDILGVKA